MANAPQKNVQIVLEYEGRKFTLRREYDHDYPDDVIEFGWTDGNDGCDCNKADYIAQECDPAFAEMSCGDKILTESINVDGKVIFGPYTRDDYKRLGLC